MFKTRLEHAWASIWKAKTFQIAHCAWKLWRLYVYLSIRPNSWVHAGALTSRKISIMKICLWAIAEIKTGLISTAIYWPRAVIINRNNSPISGAVERIIPHGASERQDERLPPGADVRASTWVWLAPSRALVVGVAHWLLTASQF